MLLNIGSIVFLSVFQWLYCYIFPPWNVQTRNSLINKIIFYFTFPVYRQTVNKPQILAGFVIIISSIHEEGASMNWINLHNCFLARSRNYENRLLACRVCVFICTSVRPSVRPSARMEQLSSDWTNFHDIWYLEYYSKICRENSIIIQNWEEWLARLKTNIYSLSYLVQFFLERDNFRTEVVEEINTRILCSIYSFFRKSCRLWDNVDKYFRVCQAPDDNMAHAHCVLDTIGYTHTHTHTHTQTIRMCNIECFATATMVSRTCSQCDGIRTLPAFCIQPNPVMLCIAAALRC